MGDLESVPVFANPFAGATSDEVWAALDAAGCAGRVREVGEKARSEMEKALRLDPDIDALVRAGELSAFDYSIAAFVDDVLPKAALSAVLAEHYRQLRRMAIEGCKESARGYSHPKCRRAVTDVIMRALRRTEAPWNSTS